MKRLMMLAAGLMLGATPAFAQLSAIDVAVAPRVGMYAPMGNLMETPTSETRIKGGFGYGLSVEFDLPTSPYDLRVSLNTVTGSDVEDGGTGRTIGEVDVLNLTGDVLFRPFPRVGIQPYFLVGAGMKKYSFANNFAPGGETSATDFTGHLGGGIDLRIGPLGVVAEVSDYISSFKPVATSKMQHDLFMMAGLRIGLF